MASARRKSGLASASRLACPLAPSKRPAVNQACWETSVKGDHHRRVPEVAMADKEKGVWNLLSDLKFIIIIQSERVCWFFLG
jgi:hypothetical protein